jgi:hypothetical protein
MKKVGMEFQNGNGGAEFSYQNRNLRAAGTRPLQQRKERGARLVGKRAELVWNVLVRLIVDEAAAGFGMDPDVHANHCETIGESETAE